MSEGQIDAFGSAAVLSPNTVQSLASRSNVLENSGSGQLARLGGSPHASRVGHDGAGIFVSSNSGGSAPRITPQHTAAVLSSTTTGKTMIAGTFLEVYDADFLHVITVPTSRIQHIPHPSLGVSRLVLCRNFTPENPSACTKGDTCKFVHADVVGAKKHPIHVNYAWRNEDAVTYPRLPSGEKLFVLAPNERPPAEEIVSERILVTRGSLMRKEHNGPLSHCAHYYFNRMCNRGERCNFIHVALIDPNASEFQRAPAPTAVAPLPRPPSSTKKIAATTSLAAAAQPQQIVVLGQGGQGNMVQFVNSNHQQCNGLAIPSQLNALPAQNAANFGSGNFSGAMIGAPHIQYTMGGTGGGPVFVVPGNTCQGFTTQHAGGPPMFFNSQQQQQQPLQAHPQSGSTPLYFVAGQHHSNGVQQHQLIPQGGSPAQIWGQPTIMTSTGSMAPSNGGSGALATSSSQQQQQQQQQTNTPSMTSIFFVPQNEQQASQVLQHQQQQQLQSMQQQSNPMDWSFVGSVFNNSSMSRSFSQSGRII